MSTGKPKMKPKLVRHLKRGSIYEEVGRGCLFSHRALTDYEPVMILRDRSTKAFSLYVIGRFYGQEFDKVGIGRMQASEAFGVGDEAVIYKDRLTDALWVRPVAEFDDPERFEVLMG